MSNTKTKIFGVGFYKTGTTSLTVALEELGYKAVHGDGRNTPHRGDEAKTMIKMIGEQNFDFPTLQKYDAFIDAPYFIVWRKMYEKYPDAKFILTIRETEAWTQSVNKYYVNRRVRPVREWQFGEKHANPAADEESLKVWVDAYEKHNTEIQEFFADSENFLVLDVFQGDGYEKLTEFLGVPKKKGPLPHKNKTTNKSKQLAKKIYKNIKRGFAN